MQKTKEKKNKKLQNPSHDSTLQLARLKLYIHSAITDTENLVSIFALLKVVYDDILNDLHD